MLKLDASESNSASNKDARYFTISPVVSDTDSDVGTYRSTLGKA